MALLALLVLLPASLAVAQQGARATGEDISKSVSVAAPDLMAKPAYETTGGGMKFKVWIMSVIKGIKEPQMKPVSSWDEDEPVKTHHVMIEVLDPMNGVSVPDAMVELKTVSPSGEESIIELNPIMAQYGGDLNLNEKGNYQLNISVNANGTSVLTPFVYSVDQNVSQSK